MSSFCFLEGGETCTHADSLHMHRGRLACALASLSDVQHDDLQRIWILRTAISESMAVEAFLDGGMSEKIILDRGWEVFNNAQHVEVRRKLFQEIAFA